MSQAIPPIKSWLHGNKLNYLALTISVFPIASPQIHAATENNLNQTVQSAQSDKVTYQGVVIDENGNPLPGVNITYKNAHGVGVITDIDGKFTFAIPSNIHSLIFSYVGMKTQTVRVSNPSEKLKVRLEPDAVSLQETVITGIYTRKAESFTGSMATYSEKELKTVGNQNVLQSLKVLDPSFIILENNLAGSDPNATMNLNIGGGSGHHDGVAHGTGFGQALHKVCHGRALLTDGNVNADNVLALLVDDGIGGDGGLAGLAVTDDQFALTASDGDHGVDGLDTGLKRNGDALALQDAGGRGLDGGEFLRLDGALAVDGLAERIDDAAEHGTAHGDIHNSASGAALVAFLDGVDGTKQNGADLVTVKVLGKAEDGLTGIGALELQKLACHGALEAGDARDAVAYLVDR